MRLHLLAIAGCAALTACVPYADTYYDSYYGYGSAPVYAAAPAYGYAAAPAYGYAAAPAYGYAYPSYRYGYAPSSVVVLGERRWDNDWRRRGWDGGRWERERFEHGRAAREGAWRGRGEFARPVAPVAAAPPVPVARPSPLASIPNPPAGGPAFQDWYHRYVNASPGPDSSR